MAILKIARMGHPILCGRAAPIEDPRHPAIRKLIDDMIATMADADGAGLAAPQVHVPARLVVFSVSEERASGVEGDRPQGLQVLINPVIEPLTEETEVGWEGCLSVPGMVGAVARLKRIRYRGLDADGKALERIANGFHARVVQHECDHLDGILYPMRMPDLSLFGFAEEIRRRMPDSERGAIVKAAE